MKNGIKKFKIIKTVFASRGINGPKVCSSAKALVLAHITRVQTGAIDTKAVSNLCSSLLMSMSERSALTIRERSGITVLNQGVFDDVSVAKAWLDLYCYYDIYTH
jgi:hypothetical protein